MTAISTSSLLWNWWPVRCFVSDQSKMVGGQEIIYLGRWSSIWDITSSALTRKWQRLFL